MTSVRRTGSFVFVAAFLILAESNLFAVGQSSLYTKQEVDAIKRFRPTVSRFLTQDYHKKDGYLLRWIRGNDFDLKKAVEALEKNYQWRQENDIDSIHTGSLTAHNKYLPCKVDGHDRQGRPILLFPFGKWKIRNYVVAGKQDDALRHARICLEKSTRAIFERAETTGQDIDQMYIIEDLTGYSVRDSLCLGCIPLTLSIASSYDSSSAFFAKNITLINSPRIFQPVLALVRNVLRIQSLQTLSNYDSDKKVWLPLVHKDIAPDQLPKSLGGTRYNIQQNMLKLFNELTSLLL